MHRHGLRVVLPAVPREDQAPLDVMEPIQIAAGIAAAVVLFVWSLPSLIQTLFTSI